MTSDLALSFIVHVARPNAFDEVKGFIEVGTDTESPKISDFFTHLYASVKDGGYVEVQFSFGGDEMHKEVASFSKMVGFEFCCVSTTDTGIKISAKKPKFVVKADGPAKIKRKPKAAPV